MEPFFRYLAYRVLGRNFIPSEAQNRTRIVKLVDIITTLVRAQ